jgi:hydroxymethylpyrimidine pyrophosphatase-like HAD family hydrolase
MTKLKWNKDAILIISDMDETIVDLYVNATQEMVKELEKLLEEGRVLFLISSQGVSNLKSFLDNIFSTLLFLIKIIFSGRLLGKYAPAIPPFDHHQVIYG